jgi:CHAD domain-containing protein
VHEARKSIKGARATLRLLRDAIPKAKYRRENETLRNAAQPLSARRDASILLKALAPLLTGGDAVSLQHTARAVHRELKVDRRRVTQSTSATSEALHVARTSLGKQQARLNPLRVGRRGWSVVGSGIGHTYRRGRQAFRKANKHSTVEALHKWRKQVKHLWLQLQLLEVLWPSVIGELADQAHKLSDYLGDDHDLAVLRTTISKGACADVPGHDSLTAAIDARREHLQGKAFILGARLYDGKAGAFTTHLKQYWRVWARTKQ